MAIEATPVIANHNYKSWTITAQDADTTTSFAHGFGVEPDMVCLRSTLSEGTTDTSTWGVEVDATNITLLKQNATGSGGANAGTTVVAKVVAWRPHSVAQ
jgi:hypothetical protein